ncbi:MAG TPA: hypothetical protein PKW42_03165, partial [bacterium]|nr:hypothetical protein [bacterium]
MRRRLLLFLVFCSVAVGSENPVLIYLPFDGNCQPGFSAVAVTPTIKGTPVFQAGYRGEGLLLGGKESATVTYRKEGLIRARQGTVSFWVMSTDWDATEDKGFYFFRFLNEAFLYKYHTFEDTMSFYCKFPAYNKYILYGAPLPLRKGVWFHVVVTWLDNVIQQYTNGERSGADFFLEPMKPGYHDQGLQFGYRYGDNHAVIDEFYILNYPLAETEVKRLYQLYREGKNPVFNSTSDGRMHLVHYPELKKVQVWLDLPETEWLKDLKRIDWWVTGADNKRYRLGQTTISEAQQPLLFDLPKQLPAGEVVVSAELVDPNGRVHLALTAEPFERRLYPWDGARV